MVSDEVEYYKEQNEKQLKMQQEQLQSAIDLLKKKYQKIDEQLKDTDAKNPNLNDINFGLLNTTNHVVIDLTLTRNEQEQMTTGAPEEKEPPIYTYEKEHKMTPRFDANQQAV